VAWGASIASKLVTSYGAVRIEAGKRSLDAMHGTPRTFARRSLSDDVPGTVMMALAIALESRSHFGKKWHCSSKAFYM